MLDLNLQQLFGPGASQTASTLTIQKSALAEAGLSTSASNRAESLIVALALVALRNWEGTITAPGGIVITAGGKPLTYRQPRDFYEKLRLFEWERKLSAGKQLDTIVAEIFLNPPTDPGTPLTPDLMNYGI